VWGCLAGQRARRITCFPPASPTHPSKTSIAQHALLGQCPEVALSAAAASVLFYRQQKSLAEQAREQQIQARERKYEQKIAKIKASCEAQLEKIHTAYRAVCLLDGVGLEVISCGRLLSNTNLLLPHHPFSIQVKRKNEAMGQDLQEIASKYDQKAK